MTFNRILTSRMHLFLLVALILTSLLAVPDIAHARNSLGIGGSEQAMTPTGPFAGILMTINHYQKEFFGELRQALKQIRDSGSGGFLLVALSFAYGIFHAAGPGHGKAIISSYMIANEVEAKRGIAISFLAAMVQATTAVILMSLLVFALRGSGIRSNDLSSVLATASYAAITALGAWMLVSKLRGKGQGGKGQGGKGQGGKGGHHHHGHDHHDHQGNGDTCSACGHAHMPDPQALSGRFDLKSALSAVIAVGIRPCSGAIVVLAFAFLNGLYLAGIVSTFAMAIGTAITVSILAMVSVWAKDVALWLTKSSGKTASFRRLVEIMGALLVFLIGLTLLLADLYG